MYCSSVSMSLNYLVNIPFYLSYYYVVSRFQNRRTKCEYLHSLVLYPKYFDSYLFISIHREETKSRNGCKQSNSSTTIICKWIWSRICNQFAISTCSSLSTIWCIFSSIKQSCSSYWTFTYIITTTSSPSSCTSSQERQK